MNILADECSEVRYLLRSGTCLGEPFKSPGHDVAIEEAVIDRVGREDSLEML